jgi:hypothetical protein
MVIRQTSLFPVRPVEKKIDQIRREPDEKEHDSGEEGQGDESEKEPFLKEEFRHIQHGENRDQKDQEKNPARGMSDNFPHSLLRGGLSRMLTNMRDQNKWIIRAEKPSEYI